MAAKKVFASVDEYIQYFPDNVQTKLNEIRTLIRKTAPHAREKISYNIPTYDLHGNLVHFAAYRNHIGFYPTPGGIDAFKQQLSKYKSAKGSIQFPLDEPLPPDLIRSTVQFRVKENLSKQKR